VTGDNRLPGSAAGAHDGRSGGGAAEPSAPHESTGPVLADGRYDAFVVDASAVDRSPGPAPAAGSDPVPEPEAMRLELTITAGEHKGALVVVIATGLGRSDVELLGTPATLTVADGRPTVHLDD
jgi:hypothetical protein